jgi:hypothetical protein
VRLLDRPRRALDRVVRAGRGRPLAGQERLDHGECLLQPREPNGASIEREAEHTVVLGGVRAASTDAELERPTRQHVERSRLLGKQDGIAVIVGNHVRADAEGPGDGGRDGERGQARQGVAQDVWHHQGCVAERLDAAGFGGPFRRSRLPRRRHQSEKDVCAWESPFVSGQ